jgi:hypothetical protein
MTPASVLKSIAALAMLAPVAAAAEADPGPDRWPIELHGRCEYAPRVAAYAGAGNGFALCDRLVLSGDGEQGAFDFRQENVGSIARYTGALTGETLTVRQIDLRGQPAKDARGSCTIYRFEGRITKVDCVATVRHLTYAASFVRRD